MTLSKIRLIQSNRVLPPKRRRVNRIFKKRVAYEKETIKRYLEQLAMKINEKQRRPFRP